MLFTDRLFLFYFLPTALILHRLALWKSPEGTYGKWPRLMLFSLTLIFYGWTNWWWLVPFLLSVIFDFLWAKRLSEAQSDGRRKLWLALSVCQNLGLLAVFKYWNLIAEGIEALNPAWHIPRSTLPLPAGISFYTFESLSFVIDVYRRDITPPRTRLEFLTYIGMFPRFIAGPIVRYRDLRNQLDRYQGMQVSEGLAVFIQGLFRKACLADSFAVFADYAFGATSQLDFFSAWIGVLAYTMQIYFDFSGYSLMAIGLGKCLGFSFPANFDRPYLATSFRDFWRRWHITLSMWLRDYLYIPLGGAKRGTARRYVNLLLTMVIGGLWHGASLMFLAWGAWHGGLLVLERVTGFADKSPRWVGRLVTFFGVTLGWVFFRAANATEATHIFKALFSPWNRVVTFNPTAALVSPVALGFSVLGLVYCFLGEDLKLGRGNPRWQQAWPLALAGLALVVLFSNEVIPFLYFQF